jgi:hypothetical protein
VSSDIIIQSAIGAPGVERRDASNGFRDSQPQLMVMVVTTRKRMALAWRVSRPPQAAASDRRGHL